MFNFFKTIIGATPLSAIPWIIAVLLGLAGAGGWLWQSHQVDDANKATAAVTVERNAALEQVGALTSAIGVDDATIKAQSDNLAANDDLIAQYQHAADDDARASVDAGNQIRSAQNADATVATYLSAPIPPSLRSVLNNGSASGVAANSADKDGVSVTAKAVGVPGTPPAVQH